MEKALTKANSLKMGSLWISQKAKEEISNISGDLAVLSNNVEEKAKWIFNKLKGKPSKTLPDLLREFNLPPGIFPQNVVCYEFDATKGLLIVHLPSVCEVSFNDSSIVRFAVRLKATLKKRKLSAIEGMKTKLVVWVKVTSIAIEGFTSDKVIFHAGVKKSRPRSAYETPILSVRVEEF